MSWRARDVDTSARCPRCQRQPSTISRLRAIGEYDGTLRTIIHALKYDKRPTLARPLATLMYRECADVLAGIDLVVPVPLHRRRLRSRGFNQAALIARALPVPCRQALRRTRATPSQTDLPAEQRHANVRDAFTLARGARVTGLAVALVG